MSEFIGSRISLISKSDIRYVGTLHEINSETSTVALENVVSFGTEGRRANSDDEIAPSDSVYEYIVFRGSDVKDLRIEEPPKENKPPQVPDDPAILGSGSRPRPQAPQGQPPQNQLPQGHQQQHPTQPQPPHFQQQPPFPYYYPPPGGRFGPQGGPHGGFPPGAGFQGMPYGPPPNWYPPPPGQGFPHPPANFSPHPMPIGPSGQQHQQGAKQQQPAPTGSSSNTDQKPTPQSKVVEQDVAVKPSDIASTATPPVTTQADPPPPPVESKPDVATALAPPAPVPSLPQPMAATKPPPTGPKSGRIVPAVPLPSPRVKGYGAPNGPLQASAGNASQPPSSQPSQAAANAAIQNATQAATAAVAAAMAKLPPAPGQKQQVDGAVDNLAKQVSEMRTNDSIRTSRQPGTGGYAAGHRGRGGRGGSRPDHNQHQTKKVEVPKTDYDFESANAKFNKQDLVKEAIATGSPVGTPGDGPSTNGTPDASLNGTAKDGDSVTIPPTTYNKSSSFFDNISSEIKDRDEANGKRPGGREWRGEEQKKNLETFGQGSVDNGYRGGFRGRGRGRGFGRGRGGTGTGGFRGGRSEYRGRGGGGNQAGSANAATESRT
ncbi:MAG: hypothetical protein M1836_002974 [Candelina mexicana]|nr:MAG: hypothetical protein M1836_002974 [Candelina mexicana]